MANLSAVERAALNGVAASLGVLPQWLEGEIQFESGWNPQAANPTSSAKGLIQFMNATAQEMGFASSAALVAQYPDRVSQLWGAVLPYLAKFRPFPTEQSLAMAVFYPAYRYVDPSTPFPSWVQAANRGIVTVEDYLNYYRARIGTVGEVAIGAVLAVGLVGLIVWAVW